MNLNSQTILILKDKIEKIIFKKNNEKKTRFNPGESAKSPGESAKSMNHDIRSRKHHSRKS